MVLGVPSVMTSGTAEMPPWCADNWDTPHMVKQSLYTLNSLIQIFLLLHTVVFMNTIYRTKIALVF